LFSYTINYHPFLPLLEPGQSPHELYTRSELLFWSVVSVAARRLSSRPTLLPRLARSVTDLLWCFIRSSPYSLTTVQALALLCTWPFPTSSSTADSTFLLAGIMLQLAVQMGLHRALNVQDFVKVPLRLSESEQAEWVGTWAACNIVVQR
jgi:transcriptional regulatory protein LEU3